MYITKYFRMVIHARDPTVNVRIITEAKKQTH